MQVSWVSPSILYNAVIHFTRTFVLLSAEHKTFNSKHNVNTVYIVFKMITLKQVNALHCWGYMACLYVLASQTKQILDETEVSCCTGAQPEVKDLLITQKNVVNPLILVLFSPSLFI